MRNIQILVVVAVVGYLGYSFLGGPSGPQSADLGQVLDRTVVALEKFDEEVKKQNISELGDAEMAKLTEFMTYVMNYDPRFYDQTLGITLMKDATFLGFADANGNNIQDSGEGKVFTVEIDSENKRLIATDTAGNGSHFGFSGAGFLAGALIGSLLSRQSAAGVKPGSFNNRTTTSRANYRAPSSARSRSRSGGLGRGK